MQVGTMRALHQDMARGLHRWPRYLILTRALQPGDKRWELLVVMSDALNLFSAQCCELELK